MNTTPPRPQRRSIRLPNFDYGSGAAYFITLCTHNRQPRFGTIVDAAVRHSPSGAHAVQYWIAIPEHFPRVTLDTFVVMPNHVHGILFFNDFTEHDRDAESEPNRRFGQPTAADLATVLRSYKSISTREINALNGTQGATVWQGNYYEKIIRSESMWRAVAQYIEANPANWSQDEFYSG